MPSSLHEALVLLFRNRPALAPELMREALQVRLPEYTQVRIESAELSELQPAEYRADLVVLLLQSRPVLGVVIEVQLARDKDKRYVWPVYVTNLRARIRCEVCLLVVADSENVAQWASRPIELGGGSCIVPWVLGPSAVPEVIEERRALEDPELAVLSAMVHGRDADRDKAAQIAHAAHVASEGLDAERMQLYVDLVERALSEAARRALRAMDPAKYEYQSKFAKRYIGLGRAEGEAKGRAEGEAKGRAEGETQGRAEVLLRQLALRFGPVPAPVSARVRGANVAQLDAVAERVLTAATLDQALEPLP